MPQQRMNQDRKNRCARMVDHRNSENVVSMELHRLEGRTRTSELDRMVQNAKRASDFLKALAHESRLMTLCILAEDEKSVGELEGLLNLRQPTVSQQLARLRADGLVSTRRDGKTIYYNLASEEARIVIGAIYDVFCRKVRKR
jgi:DNA-binding transcriptional ArsR family regulator